MHTFALRRSRAAVALPQLLEIVTPRTSTATITPADNLFRSLRLPGWIGVEIAGGAGSCRFLARTATAGERHRLEAALAAVYPQALLRPVPDGSDPAAVLAGERVVAATLHLQQPPYLPLRTWRDQELAATPGAQADPVLGIAGTLGTLPPGWRGLAQLVFRRAPSGCLAGYERYALEPAPSRERAAHGASADTSLAPVFVALSLLGLGAVAWQSAHWYAAHDWLHLAQVVAGGTVGLPGLALLARRLNRQPVYDRLLVQEKLRGIACLAQLRLAVIAPAATPQAELCAHLEGLIAAYDQYAQGLGNAFVPHRLVLHGCDLRQMRPLPCGSGPWPFARMVAALPVLTTRELAGLWHLPQREADVPQLERTGARAYLPAAGTVDRGCRIGVAIQQGHRLVVHIADETLRRHMLLIARTGRGKSTLLARFAAYLMGLDPAGPLRPALVLVDPHQDLAHAVLSRLPAGREPDLLYLDAANLERPLGLNLLDTGLGWSRDGAVESALEVLEQQFVAFWGPRMETVLRYALQTLFEANEAICAADPTHGRNRQYTLLDVPALLASEGFRDMVLPSVRDARILAWWRQYFERLDSRFRTEVIDPVQSKIKRLDASLASRMILGQPRSTFDLAGSLQPGRVIVINTASGVIGAETAALLGGTLLNLVALAVAAQARLPRAQRVPVQLLVDEFHTLPAVNYERILAELAKYGASLILATQSLANLETLGKQQGRNLRALVFANIDALFAFNTSAEDATYLVPELGEQLAVADLVLLAMHQCYARLAIGGIQQPAFRLELDPPEPVDAARVQQLAAQAGAVFGRDRLAVEQDLQSALARVEQAAQASATRKQRSGVARDAANPQDGNTAQPQPKRSKAKAARAAPAASGTTPVQPRSGANDVEEGGRPHA